MTAKLALLWHGVGAEKDETRTRKKYDCEFCNIQKNYKKQRAL